MTPFCSKLWSPTPLQKQFHAQQYIALEEILPKIFPAAYGVSICIYSTWEDCFSDNQAKELGLVVQTSSRGTKWRLELRKLTGALKRAAAVTAAAGSGVWVGLWVRAGSGNHPGHLILR